MRTFWFHVVAIGAVLAGFWVADKVDEPTGLGIFVAVALGFFAMFGVYMFKDKVERDEFELKRQLDKARQLDKTIDERKP